MNIARLRKTLRQRPDHVSSEPAEIAYSALAKFIGAKPWCELAEDTRESWRKVTTMYAHKHFGHCQNCSPDTVENCGKEKFGA